LADTTRIIECYRQFDEIWLVWSSIKAIYPSEPTTDDIDTKMETPELVTTIIDTLGHKDWQIRQESLNAILTLVEHGQFCGRAKSINLLNLPQTVFVPNW
jgi:hypothetical protein